MKLTNQKGFTIIELIVVIIVISILVALLLPNLFGVQRRARDDQRKNDLKNIKTSLEEYYADNNAYPAALADLQNFTVPSDPRGGAYTFAPAPAGCTTAADDCVSYSLTADLENDNDPLADANGNYVVNSVNQ